MYPFLKYENFKNLQKTLSKKSKIPVNMGILVIII